jgi:hypothetical protein
VRVEVCMRRLDHARLSHHQVKSGLLSPQITTAPALYNSYIHIIN